MTAAPPPLGVDTTDRVPVGDGKAYGTPAPTPTRTERTWFLAVPFAIAMVLAFALPAGVQAILNKLPGLAGNEAAAPTPERT